LERASDAALSAVEILWLGTGLHWEQLDVDLSVPGLLAGLFGTSLHGLPARGSSRRRKLTRKSSGRARQRRQGRPAADGFGWKEDISLR